MQYLHLVPGHCCNSSETFLDAYLTIKCMCYTYSTFSETFAHHMHMIMGWSARGQLNFSFSDLPPNISQQHVIVLRKYTSFLQPHFCALKRKLISISYLVYSFLLVHYKYLPQLTHDNMHLEIFWRNVKNPKN